MAWYGGVLTWAPRVLWIGLIIVKHADSDVATEDVCGHSKPLVQHIGCTAGYYMPATVHSQGSVGGDCSVCFETCREDERAHRMRLAMMPVLVCVISPVESHATVSTYTLHR
jgi:hypothetical protein